MSYDAYLNVDLGGPEPLSVDVEGLVWDAPRALFLTSGTGGNYTSNVSPMWAKALREARPPAGVERLADLSGWDCSVVGPLLERAVRVMDAHPAEFEAMNPPNGWGEWRGARDYLMGISWCAYQHPRAKLYLSH